MKLIDKDALVAGIERIRRIEVTNNDVAYNGALDEIRFYINTLEVKWVSLEKEIKDAFLEDKCNITHNVSLREFERIAKHFFELGLKAQKGE